MKYFYFTLTIFLASCASTQTLPFQKSQYPELDQRSCEVLELGNAAYMAANYRKALEIFKGVEEFDRNGRGLCTGAVYATMASSWTIIGNSLLSTNPQLAATHYKEASLYNRAFAYAVACKSGECDNAKTFWSPDRITFWRTP